MDILWKGTVSAQFRAIRGNCAFPQNFHTWKLGETTVFDSETRLELGKFMTYQLLRIFFKNAK